MPRKTTFDVMTATQYNRVFWADEGELTTALSDAGSAADGIRPAAVCCYPQSSYTNNEYTIPENVTLFANNATFRDFSNSNIIFMDTKSTIVGPIHLNTRATDPYTASGIILDGTRATSAPYSARGGNNPNTANIYGPVTYFGNQPTVGGVANSDHNALALVGGDASGEYVTHCNLGHWFINQANNCVLADANSGGTGTTGFLNDNRLWIETTSLNNCGIRHIGDSEAKLLVWGHMQALDESWIRNEGSSTKSVRFWGHLEDPQNVGGDLISGAGIRANTTSRVNLSPAGNTASVGAGSLLDGVGEESANAEEPQNPEDYSPGDLVMFKDTGDGSGDGVYLKLYYETTNAWVKISSETVLP